MSTNKSGATAKALELLRDSVKDYQQPCEPIADDDWEALQA
jgi:hypothetical protein